MARRIFASEEDVATYRPLTNLFGLTDLNVVGQDFVTGWNKVVLTCVPRWPVAVCPDCRQVSAKIHDYPRQRKIHDQPLGNQGTVLYFDSRRFWCNNCEGAFSEEIGDVVPDCTYTYRLAEIITDARRKQDVATLASLYGLGYKLVEGMLMKAGEEKWEQRRAQPLKVKRLGIDEISLVKGEGRYVLVLTDLERGLVLDLLPDRLQSSLEKWLRQPPAGISLDLLEAVAIDLWRAYRSAVTTVFPEVMVVADRFHVVQNLHKAIHGVRRLAQKQAETEEESQQLKGLRYLLLKNEANLSARDQERLQVLQEQQPILYQLWQLRQQLHDWYETDTSIEQATESLQDWLDQAIQLKLKPLDDFCKTLRNWRAEILNFFRLPADQRIR